MLKNYDDLSPVAIDCLREIGNIGSGSAASSLSEMLGKTIEMKVPNVCVLEYQQIIDAMGGPEKVITGILVRLEGDIKGMMMFLLEDSFAQVVLSTFMNAENVQVTKLGDMELSVITNVATIPGSTQRVEYAIRMPGADGGSVWLPIDSKFPGDTYAHLQDAYASGDAQAVEDARHALELVLRSEARDIREKYVEPPYTTAFGILFLPFEGLYAEVVNAGLLEVLQRDYQVNVAGPSTMAALLNSLQMGFKTLAIQKRSGEVWQLLGAVKTEFDKFGQGLAKMQQRLRQTDEELDQLIGVRSRAISRKLRSVQSLDEASASALLEIDDMNELPKALSETSETSGKVGEY